MSIVFELHDATDRKIGPLRQVIGPTWQDALVDDGTFQFQLHRADPQQPLVVEGSIVHIFVDGQDVVQYLVEDIDEHYGEAGQDIVAYAGRDIRTYLDRALLYPDGWDTRAVSDPRATQYGNTILTNGDFEAILGQEWTLPPAPGVVVARLAGAGTEVDAKGNPGGSALHAVVTGSVPETIVARQAGQFNSDVRTATGDTTWRIAGAVKPTPTQPAAGAPAVDYGCGVRVRYYDDSGNQLGVPGDVATVADVWNALQHRFVVPASAATYTVELWVRGAGTFDFDLIRLQVVYTDALPVYPPRPVPGIAFGPNIVRDGIMYQFGSQGGRIDPTFDLNNPPWKNPNQKFLRGEGGGTIQPDGTTVYHGAAFIDQRIAVDNDGLVLYQDLVAEPGRGYTGTLLVGNASVGAGYPITKAQGTFVWRQFLDGQGQPVGPREPTLVAGLQVGAVDVTAPAHLATIVAPEGATTLRLELWAPAGFPNAAWGDIVIQRGVISGSDQPPGVEVAYDQQRLPAIIRDMVDRTALRLGAAWPVTCGTLEYNHAYDVLDGVLIPKDEVASAIFRFDPVGQAIRTLSHPDRVALTGGDLVMNGLQVNFLLQRGRDRSQAVVFREGIDVLTVPKKHSARDVKSKLVVEGQGEGINAVSVEVADPALVAKYGVREGFLDRKGVAHLRDLHKEGLAALTTLNLQATAITVETKVPSPFDDRPQGYRPYGDYGLGDSVTLDVPHLGLRGVYRIVKITCTPDAGGGLAKVALDLDASAYDAFVQNAKSQLSTAQSLSVQQRYPQGHVSFFQADGAENLDKDHPFVHRFYMPSTPLFTNQVQLAFQGLSFRSTVRVSKTTVQTQTGGAADLTTGSPGSLPSGNTGPAGAANVATPTFTVALPAHTHTYTELAHTHPVGVPGHTHAVEVPTIEYGIFEQGAAPQGLTIEVNGVALDPAAYGFTDTGGANMEIGHAIQKGWNTVTFSAKALGRVAVQITAQCYLESGIATLS